jgi:tRNA pseudouridine65 synthase
MPPLTLLYRDDDLAVIDKPAGLLVHPSALDAHETRSALTLLQAQLGERLWPLHRLDKATSGVLLFARHVDAARRWGQAFEQGAVRKQYLALVRGWLPEAGEIDHPLARDPERPSQGQPRLNALTRYRRLACFEWPFSVDGRHAGSRYALMHVEPLTGRRHQIRRHFKHIAHPLIGDTTHGKSAHNHAVAQWLGVQRLWLHALRIEGPAVEVIARGIAEGRSPARGGDRSPPTLRGIEAPPGTEWQPLLRTVDTVLPAARPTPPDTTD